MFRTLAPLAIGFAFTTTLLLTGTTLAYAARCQSQIGFTGGLHCGLDSDPSPAHPTQACTEAAIANLENLPLTCEQGWRTVIYDLDQPWPVAAAQRSRVIIRASKVSPCAGMADKSVPITGFAVGCWSPPDDRGCRTVKFFNGGSMCMHIQHQLLGDGCAGDCANVSTEQIVISNAGAGDRYVCPPMDETQSCRASRFSREEVFRLWFGGYCATNGCANPGIAPTVGEDTCVSQWGATYLGYARGRSHPLGFGYYDWKTGAFKVDYRGARNTCGKLGECLHPSNRAPWDFSIVAVPRTTTPPPCLGAASTCNPGGCIP